MQAWGEEKVNDFISMIYGLLAIDHIAADLPENAHQEWDKDHITEYIPQIFDKVYGLHSLAQTNMQRFCLGMITYLRQMEKDLAKEEMEAQQNGQLAVSSIASTKQSTWCSQGIHLPRCPKNSIDSANRFYIFGILTGAVEWGGNDPDAVGLHPDTFDLFLLKLLHKNVPKQNISIKIIALCCKPI
jgi:hypothetical protein